LVVLAMLAACAPPTPKVVKETVVVTKEVPVEVTKIVEKPVEVTKLIEVTPPPKVTVTLAYNRFLTMSFAEGWPSPFDAIKTAVETKYPNIEVTLNIMPDAVGPMHDAFVTWFAAKDSTVDIVGIDSPWVTEFGEAGWLMPLNDLMTPEMKEKLSKEHLDAYSYKGKILGIPFWGSLGGLYYRKDLLDEYGFKPPETYDDLVTICETILPDHPEMIGFAWQGLKDEALVCNFSEFFIGFGGRYLDEEGKCALNSPEGVAALKYMVDLIETGISPREVTTWKEAECEIPFAEGKAIFARAWQSTAHWLDDPKRSKVVGKWGLIPNPAQPGGKHASVTGGFAFGINKFTDVPEEAWKVLEVIGSYEVQKAFAMAWGPLQPHKDLATDEEVLEAIPELPMVKELMKAATPRFAVPGVSYFECSDIVQDEIHAAITGIKTPKEALDDLCARVDALRK